MTSAQPPNDLGTPANEHVDPAVATDAAAAPASLMDFERLAKQSADMALALARLAAAEAQLSAVAIQRTLALRVQAALTSAIAVVCLALALTMALAEWLGSWPLTLAIVGALFAVTAVVCGRRAQLWRSRVGFNETRAALQAALPTAPDRKQDGP